MAFTWAQLQMAVVAVVEGYPHLVAGNRITSVVLLTIVVGGDQKSRIYRSRANVVFTLDNVVGVWYALLGESA